MRSKILPLIALFIFSTGIVGCDLESSEEDYVQDVIDCIADYKSDLKDSLQSIDSNSNYSADFQVYLESLQVFVLYSERLNHIDTSDCPSDFRRRFNDYARAVNTFTNTLISITSGTPNLNQINLDAQIKEIDYTENALYELAKDKYDAYVPSVAWGL